MAKKKEQPQEIDPSVEPLPDPNAAAFAAEIDAMNAPTFSEIAAQKAGIPPGNIEVFGPPAPPPPPPPRPEGDYRGNVKEILGTLWEDDFGNVYEIDQHLHSGEFILRLRWRKPDKS